MARRFILAAAQLITMVPLVAADPVTASTYTVGLPADVQLAPDRTSYTTLLSTRLTLAAGESRRVSDRLGATISTREGAEVDNRITCLGPTGDPVAEHSSGTNHPGSAAGELGLTETLLLRAASAGTYTCQIRAQTYDSRTGFVMTAVKSGLPYSLNGTYLRISSADEPGSHEWFNDQCDSPGTDPRCIYLGGSGDPQSTHLFTGDAPWISTPDTTQVDVVGTYQITSCPSSTSSCVDPHRGGDDTAEIQTTLVLRQLYPDGRVCRVTVTGGTQASGVYYIPNSVHHLPISYHLTAPVAPNCGGSVRFSLELAFGRIIGNPVKLDGGSFNVINSVRGAATATVPDVVGTAESAAVGALQAAGFRPVVVQRVMNPAPVGTVLQQNAPGGTVEPVGSEVDVTVSRGQATVPDVRGWGETAARRAIADAGLTASVSTTNTCIDTGSVQLQHPAGGTAVLPGTEVGITVSTCTNQNPGGGDDPPREPR